METFFHKNKENKDESLKTQITKSVISIIHLNKTKANTADGLIICG